MLSTLHDPSPLWHQLAHGENDLLKDGVRLKDRKFCLKFARNIPTPLTPAPDVQLSAHKGRIAREEAVD